MLTTYKHITLGFLLVIASSTAIAECIGPVIMGQCRGTEVNRNSNSDNSNYSGSSGASYQYDLSSPLDRNRYSIDNSAQIRDSLNVNPRRQLDQSMGQYGGGITGD
jgi:hypothetical protein